MAKLESSDGRATIHEAHECVLQEIREPLPHGCDLPCLLQFLPRPPNAESDACDGSRTHGSRLEFAGIGGIIRARNIHNGGVMIKRTRIMYIESKAEGLNGPARIGRVTFNKTGGTLYYKGQSFQSLKGRGFKANYRENGTMNEYWISGPRRDGLDRLYGKTGLGVEIDDDVREEYWTEIRRKPELKSRKRT